MIVDDESHIRLMLKKLLESMGIPEIVEASNGLEACRLYGEDPADLVIMDINMPHLDGLQTLKKICEVDPDATVIMLTSIGTRQAVEASADSGAAFFIRKDTPLSQIKEKLSELIEEIF